MKTSKRLGIFLWSVRQYDGFPVDRIEILFFIRHLSNSLPFGLIRRELHQVCLALKSPPSINLGPSLLKKFPKSKHFMLWGGKINSANRDWCIVTYYFYKSSLYIFCGYMFLCYIFYARFY